MGERGDVVSAGELLASEVQEKCIQNSLIYSLGVKITHHHVMPTKAGIQNYQ